MADFKWDEYPDAGGETGFDWNQFQDAEKEAAKPSQLESGLRGLAQGAGMGFADEITGGLESAAGSLGLVPDKTYEQARDESRANYHAAQEANPGTYGAGQIGGSLATLAIPGVGAAKGAGLLANAGRAALQGGAMGLGESEAKDLSGLARDTATGATVGGALGGLSHGVGSAVNTLAPKFANVAEGAKNFVNENGARIAKKVGDVAEAGAVAYGGLTNNWAPAGVVSGARRFAGGVVPKLANTALNKLPDILKSAPEAFGKYAKPLMSAMQRGGTSLGATHYVLQNSDPEYRQMLKDMQENE